MRKQIDVVLIMYSDMRRKVSKCLCPWLYQTRILTILLWWLFWHPWVHFPHHRLTGIHCDYWFCSLCFWALLPWCGWSSPCVHHWICCIPTDNVLSFGGHFHSSTGFLFALRLFYLEIVEGVELSIMCGPRLFSLIWHWPVLGFYH